MHAQRAGGEDELTLTFISEGKEKRRVDAENLEIRKDGGREPRHTLVCQKKKKKERVPQTRNECQERKKL